jgi:CRP-like cAMP-binding protein
MPILASRSEFTASLAENSVLSALPMEIYDQLSSHLRPVYLPVNDALYDFGQPIRSIYFPLDCVVSSLAIMEDGATVEVSMVGSEGVVGMSAILGGGISSHWTRVQVAGNAMRMRAAALRELSSKNDSLQRVLLGSYRSLITQISQRAVCNCRHTVSQRLCCWLLMIRDRMQSNDLPLTQEIIAQRLGARRAGITNAAGVLQNEAVISYSRGLIHILDAGRLEELACECYKIHRRAFQETGKTSKVV